MTALDLDTLKQQAKSVDVPSLAEQYTEIRKIAAAEWAGPCPKCGGTDRFHAGPDWWFCRQCHERRGDSIELLRWLQGMGFRDAVAALTGEALAPVPVGRVSPATPVATGPAEGWPEKAASLLASAHDRLYSEAGLAGREYLFGRGLYPETWERFGLGFEVKAPVREKCPAIAMPWIVDGAPVAIRYRFIYPNGDTKAKSLKGSRPGGHLFGLQALAGADALVLCEGEINAMSCAQVGVDALSVGSESARIPDAVGEIAARYSRFLVWFDREERTREAMAMFPGAIGSKSPNGNDANDLLRMGLLGPYLGKRLGFQLPPRPAKPPLPSWEEVFGLETLQDAKRLQDDLSQRFYTALGRNDGGFYIKAPDAATMAYLAGSN